MEFSRFTWQRDPANPVLPPDAKLPHESTRCMNPFVMYYSGHEGTDFGLCSQMDIFRLRVKTRSTLPLGPGAPDQPMPKRSYVTITLSSPQGMIPV